MIIGIDAKYELLNMVSYSNGSVLANQSAVWF